MLVRGQEFPNPQYHAPRLSQTVTNVSQQIFADIGSLLAPRDLSFPH